MRKEDVINILSYIDKRNSKKCFFRYLVSNNIVLFRTEIRFMQVLREI